LAQYTDDHLEISKHPDQQVVIKLGGTLTKKPSNLKMSVTAQNMEDLKPGFVKNANLFFSDDEFSEMTEQKTHNDEGSDDEGESVSFSFSHQKSQKHLLEETLGVETQASKHWIV
jgi:hypothetical protein